MRTVIGERDTAAVATASPAAPSRRGRLIRIAFGSVCSLVALALIGSAIAGIVGLERNRDGTGYFVTGTHHYATPSYALTTESLHVGGVTGFLEAGLLRLRITATSRDATTPLFIGIARADDVDRYLGTVAHDELRDLGFDPFRVAYRRLGTGAPRALPSGQTFWRRRAIGTGMQTISWPVEKGRWSAVVMNADGRRDVSVDARLGARLSAAWWLVAAFLAVGALSLLGGVALLRSGARRQPPETPAVTEEA